MSEDTKYLEDALEMIGNQPAAIIEQPHQRIALREGLGEEWTVAWVKLSTAFKPHIKELKGSPLAVWLFISLSINKQGVAFPSILKIAEETGYSHQGVLDAVAVLEEKGYLKVRRGERRYNLYEPEFAAIGKTNEPSETVNLVESSELSQVLADNQSTFFPKESTPLDSNKRNKKEQEIISSANKTVDFILQTTLHPKAIQDAIRDHFRLTPRWEGKYERQWMQWAIDEANVTPEQIRAASEVWRSDKRFNWSVPTLKGIHEHWLELVSPKVSEINSTQDRSHWL